MKEEVAFKPSGVSTAVKFGVMNQPITLEALNSGLHDQLSGLPRELQQTLRGSVVDDVKAQIERQFGSLKDQEKQLTDKKAKLEALKSIDAWLGDLIANGVRMEPNHASRLHKLIEAGKCGRIADALHKEEMLTPKESWDVYRHAFLVKHDWAAAFDKASDVGDEIKLPFELCAFEFRINDKSVTALAWDCDQATEVLGKRLGFTLMIESGDWWVGYGGSKDHPDDILIPFVWKQLRAICIALDAEVATHEVVRAPAELNRKRERAGKEPIRDHYVIDLARRHRIANPTSSGEPTQGKVRLHFRRGHWRHFETHKTWIKWMLVGNPSLGFIQKRYAL